MSDSGLDRMGKDVKIHRSNGERIWDKTFPNKSFRTPRSNRGYAIAALKASLKADMAALERKRDALRARQTADMVNRPPHYIAGKVEYIDALEAALGEGFIDFCLWSAMKYIWRWRRKGGVEDLKKGRWYLERALATLEPKR